MSRRPSLMAPVPLMLLLLLALALASPASGALRGGSHGESSWTRLPQLPPATGSCEMIMNDVVRPHKILMLLDTSFLPLFQNWLVYYENACGFKALASLEIVCMDRAAGHLLANLTSSSSSPSFPLHCSTYSSPLLSSRHHAAGIPRTAAVWVRRLEIMTALLARGTDVVLSDADALWLRDPFPELVRHAQHSHVVASRGWFPFQLSQRWGSTLCMGLTYVRAAEVTHRFFEAVRRHMQQQQSELEGAHRRRAGLSPSTPTSTPMGSGAGTGTVAALSLVGGTEPDDQFSVNYALEAAGIEWPADMAATQRTAAHTGQLSLAGGGTFNVTLLAESQFVRNCVDVAPDRQGRGVFPTPALRRTVQARTAHATVVHCLLTGDAVRKQHYLSGYSLWRLPFDAQVAHDYIVEDIRNRTVLMPRVSKDPRRQGLRASPWFTRSQ